MPSEKLREHEIILKNRGVLELNAVNKIEYLSQEAVLVNTDMGRLAVRGDGLYVENLESSTGELLIKGNVMSLTYLEKDAQSKWFKRVFR